MEVRRYTPELKEAWDDFVSRSKNGVFLFRRDYMDYHADRFADHSLMFSRDGALVALLPANRDGDVLHSHQGLTFGGFVTDYWMKAALMLEVVDALLGHCRNEGVSNVAYKAIPHIYHLAPAEEDLYALFRAGARLVRRDVAFTVDQLSRPEYREQELKLSKKSNSRMRNRLRNLRKARESGVRVEHATAPEDLRRFVQVLEDVLMKIHGATPVHTYDELQLLFDRFPEEMKLFVARSAADELLAGAIVYESNRNLAHVQYSANSEEGRKVRALDVVFDELSANVYADRRWLDFGTSVEDEGRTLNESLAAYKESQGARSVTYDHYELPI
jgi:hypothetical protein